VVRRLLSLSALAAVGTLVTALLVLVPIAHAAGTLFVSPLGSDANSGTAAAQALKTIQAALDKADPGTTVQLAAGTYMQDAVTKSNGVTLAGPTGAVVKGAGNGRVFEINHDDTTLKGFTIDGKVGSGEGGVRDKLIFVIGTRAGDGGQRHPHPRNEDRQWRR
jgi:hypothetical protein